MTLQAGDSIPEFTLYDNQRNQVGDDDLKGQKTLVMFFPYAFSGTCTGEICELRDNHARLADVDAKIVAITCDPVPANAAWAKANEFTHPVLSDFWPHGTVARAFGVFNDKLGCANRVSFAVDADGKITEVFASDSLGEARDFDAQVEALSEG